MKLAAVAGVALVVGMGLGWLGGYQHGASSSRSEQPRTAFDAVVEGRASETVDNVREAGELLERLRAEGRTPEEIDRAMNELAKRQANRQR